MREIATVLGGVGLLIFAYLVMTNSSGFGVVVSSISSLFTNSVSVLQGQGAANVSNPLTTFFSGASRGFAGGQ